MRIQTQAQQWPERVAFVKQALTDDEKEKLLREFQDSGGFTFRDHPGDGPDSGFMVSLPNSERTTPVAEHDAEDIGSFHDEVRPVLDAHPDHYHGDWGDDGLAYQDVSRNIADPWEAARRGQEDDQLAIFDLNQGDSIDTPDAVNQLFWKGDLEQPGYIFSRLHPPR